MPNYRSLTKKKGYFPGGEAAAAILRDFLNGKTLEDGGRLTNETFALSIGIKPSSAPSQVSHWLRGEPISSSSLLSIIERYPDFPLLRYIEATSRIKGRNTEHLLLALQAVRQYEQQRDEMYELYEFIPPESLARGDLASLASPGHDFEQELLADRANDRPTTREERQGQVTRYRAATSAQD